MSKFVNNTPFPGQHVHSVGEINEHVRTRLEEVFSHVVVEGEIDHFTQPSSGHWYFSLKDPKIAALLNCVMFRHFNQRVDFSPAIGMKVQLRGKLSLYVGRGSFQLIAAQMFETGAGALQRAFEKLKQKLAAEGLFDEDKKKPLPDRVHHLAVLSSDTGAALKDVLSVLQRRFPLMNVTVLPIPVQGTQAPQAIIRALHRANSIAATQSPPLNTILLTRGGGSPEDLWCFNDEGVVRAIADSALPVVSAIGHEIDFSLADFAADVRAATPSAAAELLSPDGEQLAKRVREMAAILRKQSLVVVQRCQLHLNAGRSRLRHPEQRLQNLQQRCDDMEIRLRRACREQMRVWSSLPAALHANLQRSMEDRLRNSLERYQRLHTELRLMNPLDILQRGYAVLRNERGKILLSFKETRSGEKITARLAEGKLSCRVESSES